MLNELLSLPADRLMASLSAEQPGADFLAPAGEQALVAADSVSWQVFRNPLTMYVGGITAVLLELAEPRVGAGVWEHSSFRKDPARRLRRTGLAAMMTVYGAKSRVEALTSNVRRMHGKISGITADGMPYRADDEELLRWVQVTAAWSFLRAYRYFVREISTPDRDLYYAEGQAGARLYGVSGPPCSESAVDQIFAFNEPRLQPSSILTEFLSTLRAAPILPLPLRWLQPVVARAAVDLVPAPLRARLELDGHGGLGAAERLLLRALAARVEKMTLRSSPSSQACVRLGLPADYLATQREQRLRASARPPTRSPRPIENYSPPASR